jgi:hypothetical protein
MMTPDDGFDARLSAAFEKANAEIKPEAAFTRRVESRLGKVFNARNLVLGGAGASGSALAASQLERLADGIHFNNPLLAGLFDMVGIQSMVAGGVALLALTVVIVLPGRRI